MVARIYSVLLYLLETRSIEASIHLLKPRLIGYAGFNECIGVKGGEKSYALNTRCGPAAHGRCRA